MWNMMEEEEVERREHMRTVEVIEIKMNQGKNTTRVLVTTTNVIDGMINLT